MLIAFLAIIIALCLGFAVHQYRQSQPKRSRTDIEALRQSIVIAEQKHKPRAQLRKRLVEEVRQELLEKS